MKAIRFNDIDARDFTCQFCADTEGKMSEVFHSNKVSIRTMTRKIKNAALELGLTVEYSNSNRTKSRYLKIYDRDYNSITLRISDHRSNPSRGFDLGWSEYEVGDYSQANGNYLEAISYIAERFKHFTKSTETITNSRIE